MNRRWNSSKRAKLLDCAKIATWLFENIQPWKGKSPNCYAGDNKGLFVAVVLWKWKRGFSLLLFFWHLAFLCDLCPCMEIVQCGLLFYTVECHGKFDLITATSLNKLRVTDKKAHQTLPGPLCLSSFSRRRRTNSWNYWSSKIVLTVTERCFRKHFHKPC